MEKKTYDCYECGNDFDKDDTIHQCDDCEEIICEECIDAHREECHFEEYFERQQFVCCKCGSEHPTNIKETNGSYYCDSCATDVVAQEITFTELELEDRNIYECPECKCATGNDWGYVNFSNKNIIECPQCKNRIYYEVEE